jgi:hypothetical protein
MGSFEGDVGPEDTLGPAGRREFLRKAVVGSGALVVPAIITVDPASAQALTSPPPQPPGRPESPPADVGSPPATAPPPPAGGQQKPPADGRMAARTALPRTGMDLDRLVAAGLAATAGGAALVLWSADAEAAGAKAAHSKAADSRSEA